MHASHSFDADYYGLLQALSRATQEVTQLQRPKTTSTAKCVTLLSSQSVSRKPHVGNNGDIKFQGETDVTLGFSAVNNL